MTTTTTMTVNVTIDQGRVNMLKTDLDKLPKFSAARALVAELIDIWDTNTGDEN